MPKKKIKPKSKTAFKKIRAKIGFIGAGNMAEALIQGLLSAKTLPAGNICAYDPLDQRLGKLQKKYKIKTATDNLDLLSQCKIIILAVKPQSMLDLSREMKGGLLKKHILISIVAGLTTNRLKELLGGDSRMIRVMPNTPALIGCGASAIYKTHSAKRSDLVLTQTIFEAVGYVTVLKDEDLMHTVTGLSGSGPAYVFYFLEALIQGGIQNGLDKKIARELAIQTILGAVKMTKETGEDPKELRKKVSSPGGTTLEGIKTLEEGFFLQNIARTIDAATHRSRELALLF